MVYSVFHISGIYNKSTAIACNRLQDLTGDSKEDGQKV